MAGFIKVEVKKIPTQALNMQVNKEVFYNFKVKCKENRLPMNVVLETFMQQYANRKFDIGEESIVKWRADTETDTLNTTFNKKIYTDFKYACKHNGYFLNGVITAFMDEYVQRNLLLEFREVIKES